MNCKLLLLLDYRHNIRLTHNQILLAAYFHIRPCIACEKHHISLFYLHFLDRSVIERFTFANADNFASLWFLFGTVRQDYPARCLVSASRR